MTEEVQVTSSSTYLPVTLWGGLCKQLGGCKQKILYCWFTQRITVSTGKSVPRNVSELFSTKIVSLIISIRNMVVESRQNFYLRDLGFLPTCEFILLPSGF
jgi:hypothetical protein